MKIFLITFLCLLAGSTTGYADTFDDLLQKIQAQTTRELEENTIREKRFIEARDKQQEILEEAQATLKGLEAESERLKSAIDDNEQEIADLEEKLGRKTGDLGELFGVVRQVAGELRADYDNAMTSVHFPERSAFLNRLSERKELPDIPALETMWQTMVEELDETGNVKTFTASVIGKNGEVSDQNVTRIGAYGAVSRNVFLTYDAESGLFAEALRQPPLRYRRTADNFDDPKGDFIKIMIDPTRGQLLEMLTQKPDLGSRIRQGGIIGYIIICLGISGLILGGVRFGRLALVEQRINRQVRDMTSLSDDNPLGRIAMVYEKAGNVSREKKEVVLDEAVVKEIPGVEKYNNLIKLLAAVSPLLGLLGTVTGMIITFQSITLFGTSDPKLMAGGISTALVTTVLGLSVAIPLLFTHTIVTAKSKNIIDVIEHQSIGLAAKEMV